MAVLDRFLGELQALRPRIAEESLTNPPLQEGAASFAFGRAVGRLEGLKLAEEVLNKLLREPDEDERGTGRNRTKA